MKKEDFFDTLEDVEQKYISEAFFDDLEDSPSVARPGKAKITPLKVLAPIAACLALAVGAAIGVPKLVKLAAKPGESSVDELDPNMSLVKNYERGAYVPDCEVVMNFTADALEETFVNDCMGTIANENPDIISNVTSWKVSRLSYLCNLGHNDDYIVQPMTNGHSMPEIGARVFHRLKVNYDSSSETYEIVDHGEFGVGCETLDISDMVDNEDQSDFYPYFFYPYYYRADEDGDVKTVKLQTVSYDSHDTCKMKETTILEKRDFGDKCLYYNVYGESIREEEFIGIWNTYAFIPKFYTEFTDEEVEQCREALKSAHGISDSFNVRWRDAEFDLDFDGTKELLLSPRNHNVKGVYVFAKTSDGIKEVGSFDTEFGYCKPEEVRVHFESTGNVFPYYETCGRYRSDDMRINYADFYLNDIVIDENGNISTKTFAEEGVRVVDPVKLVTEYYYILNGEEVDYDTFSKEWYKLTCYSEHDYNKTYVTTDPANDAWK